MCKWPLSTDTESTQLALVVSCVAAVVAQVCVDK